MEFQTSLEDTSCSRKLVLLDFPLRVTQEVVDVDSIASDVILKVLSLSPLEFMEFLEVGESGGRYFDGGFCAVYGFAQELFSGYLFFGGRLVLDARGSSAGLHSGLIVLVAELGDMLEWNRVKTAFENKSLPKLAIYHVTLQYDSDHLHKKQQVAVTVSEQASA